MFAKESGATIAIRLDAGQIRPCFPKKKSQFQTPPRFGGEDFQLLDIVVDMAGLKSFADEYQKANLATIEGIKLKLLPLDRILHSKKTVGRVKDKSVIPALEAALKTVAAKTRK